MTSLEGVEIKGKHINYVSTIWGLLNYNASKLTKVLVVRSGINMVFISIDFIDWVIGFNLLIQNITPRMDILKTYIHTYIYRRI